MQANYGKRISSKQILDIHGRKAHVRLKEFSKSPWECKVKKRVEETRGKQTGPGCPRESKWDTGARQ